MLGNQQLTKRFAYQGKQYSSNPWQKFGGASENEFNIQNTKFKKENSWLVKNKNDAQNKKGKIVYFELKLCFDAIR